MNRCEITLIYCWVEAIYGDPKRVKRVLDKAEIKIAKSKTGTDLLKAEFETVRSQAYYSLGDNVAAERSAKNALDLFPRFKEIVF